MILSRKILVFIFFQCLAFNVFANSALPPQANWILKKFLAIEKNIKKMKKKTFSLDAFNSEEGAMELYYQNQVLKKLVIISADDGGKIMDHYYFSNGSLILCRSISNYYPLNKDGQPASKIETKKHYLLYKKGELILPNQTGSIRAEYIKLGQEKRNNLIDAMGFVLIKDTK